MNNILSCLEGVRTVIIAGHTRPDGDCVGACMGLWHYLRDNYPEIEADVRLEPVPESYKVIAGVEQIISSYEDEVNSGYECGMSFEKYNDIKEGDQIEAFVMEEVPR